MIPSKKVEELILRHKSLEGDLSSGNIDKKLFATKSSRFDLVILFWTGAGKYLVCGQTNPQMEF